jgi:hypothetical protein
MENLDIIAIDYSPFIVHLITLVGDFHVIGFNSPTDNRKTRVMSNSV